MFPGQKPEGRQELRKEGGWRPPSEKPFSLQGVTVTWKAFSPKYVMPMEGAFAALGSRAVGVTPAAWVSTHFLFAKVRVQHTAP